MIYISSLFRKVKEQVSEGISKAYLNQRLLNTMRIQNGDFSAEGLRIKSLDNPLYPEDAATRSYVDSQAFVGDMGNRKIVNLSPPTNSNDAVTKSYVDDNKFIGNMNGERVSNLGTPMFSSDAATKKYVDDLEFRGDMENRRITNLEPPRENTDAATKSYVDGAKFTGDMENRRIANLADPSNPSDASTKKYVDGRTFTGDMENRRIVNLGNPSNPQDAATKIYSDQISEDLKHDMTSIVDDFNLMRQIMLNGLRKPQQDGNYDAEMGRIENIADPINPQDAVTKGYMRSQIISLKEGKYNARNRIIYNLEDPTENQEAATKSYVDGNRFTGDMGNERLMNLAEPLDNQDAVTKRYVDTFITNLARIAGSYMEINDEKTAFHARYARIQNLAEPIDPQDAVTKRYADKMRQVISLGSNFEYYFFKESKIIGVHVDGLTFPITITFAPYNHALVPNFNFQNVDELKAMIIGTVIPAGEKFNLYFSGLTPNLELIRNRTKVYLDVEY